MVISLGSTIQIAYNLMLDNPTSIRKTLARYNENGKIKFPFRNLIPLKTMLYEKVMRTQDIQRKE